MKITEQNNFLFVKLDSSCTRNAFSLKEAQQLQANLKDKNILGLVLTAEGSVFCSGGNLQEYASLKTKKQGQRINRQIAQALQILSSSTFPKLAVVDGDCFGGGLELLSCFDWVVATPKSFFALWQRKMGLSFGWGGYERLLKRCSERELKSWLLSAEIKTVYWAYDHHLVDEIISEKNKNMFIQNWMGRHVQLSHKTYEVIKSLNSKSERKSFDELWWSKEHLQLLMKSTGNRK